MKTTLTLSALLAAGNLLASTYYLDSSPSAPLPFNPCLTCSTSTNEDGSIQVHDPLPEQSFSMFSQESSDSIGDGRPYVVVTVHMNLIAQDRGDEYLLTNGYGSPYVLLWDSYTGWNPATNLVLVYTNMDVGSRLITGYTAQVMWLWPSLTCYDFVTVDVAAHYSDGSLAHMTGSLQMQAQKTSCMFEWALDFNDQDHSVRGLSMGLAPDAYGGFVSMGRTQVIAVIDHPDGPTPAVCTPQNPQQNYLGTNGFPLTGAQVLIAVGGYQPDTDYQIVRSTNGPYGPYKFDQLITTSDYGYGCGWVTQDANIALFRVIPLP